MARIELNPFYRHGFGINNMASLMDVPTRTGVRASPLPEFNVEILDEDRFEVAVAVAGYDRDHLEIETQNGVLTIRGRQSNQHQNRQYLHRGIATGDFERRFRLAEHVDVSDAQLTNGLLKIALVRQIPEALKPRSIAIQGGETAAVSGFVTLNEDSNLGNESEAA